MKQYHAHVRFGLLGGMEADLAGRELPLGGPQQRLVLALLLAARGEVVSTDRIIEAVWGERAPADPKRSIQVYVSNLRAVLPGVDIEHREGGYVAHVEAEQIDVERFRDLVESGVALVEDDPDAAAEVLREALELWRGRPFGELVDEDALAGEVAKLEELRLLAAERRAAAELNLGRHAEVVGELRDLTDEAPTRERLWAHLIRALYRSGRQAEALEAYETARSGLADELGIEPSPFLRELHTKVLRQDPGLDYRTA